jgi:hypothetical protein
VTFSGGTTALVRVFYGKRAIAEEELTVAGDPEIASRFIDLFALPPKVEGDTR